MSERAAFALCVLCLLVGLFGGYSIDEAVGFVRGRRPALRLTRRP